jgi:fatty acid desaturase
MSARTATRDYSLVGEEAERAAESGLAGAKWYASSVSRKKMKEMMVRAEAPTLRDTALWFALILGFGGLGVLTWGTWWAVPVFIVYGVLYGSASDSRWHEYDHGTAFRSR